MTLDEILGLLQENHFYQLSTNASVQIIAHRQYYYDTVISNPVIPGYDGVFFAPFGKNEANMGERSELHCHIKMSEIALRCRGKNSR